MRFSIFFIGATATALIGAGVMGVGCSSSNSNNSSNNNSDGGADGGCAYTQDLAANADPLIACFTQYCSKELRACSSDCTCNTSTVKSLQCLEADGGEVPCFAEHSYSLVQVASSDTPAKNLLSCLEANLSMCGVALDGGPDGASPEGGSDGGMDAGSEPDGDAGAMTGPDADAGNAPDADGG